MASFNKVIVAGNLTRDIELRYTTNGVAVAEFCIAVTEKYNDKETTAFINVTVWKKQAENCAKFLAKGSSVLVDGKWTVDAWEDKDTGKKRQKAFVTALSVQFLSKPANQEQGNSQPPQQNNGYQAPQQGGFPAMPNDMQGNQQGNQSNNVAEDDIPF